MEDLANSPRPLSTRVAALLAKSEEFGAAVSCVLGEPFVSVPILLYAPEVPLLPSIYTSDLEDMLALS